MAKFTMFMLCDSINNVQDTNGEVRQQLIAPQITLRPQFVPGTFSFGIAVGIREVSLHSTNKIRFTISNPDGEIIEDSGGSELPPVVDSDNIPAEFQGFMMNVDIRNMPILTNGNYLFSLYVNDELVGTQEIPVFQRTT